MKTCWFTVIEVRGQWWIDCEGKAYGPTNSEDEATQYARLIAETYGPNDRVSQVWIPSPSGYRLFWSSDGSA